MLPTDRTGLPVECLLILYNLYQILPPPVSPPGSSSSLLLNPLSGLFCGRSYLLSVFLSQLTNCESSLRHWEMRSVSTVNPCLDMRNLRLRMLDGQKPGLLTPTPSEWEPACFLCRITTVVSGNESGVVQCTAWELYFTALPWCQAQGPT